MVTDGLYQTGLAGYPLEYLNQRALSGLPQPLTHAEISRYLADVQTERTSPDGVFGMKMQFSPVRQSVPGRRREGNSTWEGVPRVLFRCHSLQQARQDKSGDLLRDCARYGQMEFTRDPSDERSSALAVDGANVMKILNEIRFLVSETRAWRDMIAMGKFNAIEVYYEDLVNDYQAEMDRVMKLLGIPRVLVAAAERETGGQEGRRSQGRILALHRSSGG